ncbi:septum site-determining protein Ssd [Amycolatopsis thermophila]|uniref:Secretion/DNA translocation related CpaE-like protein n=1 Tax=Amycolatopsis thermophila TaxID=206084 RepID=A0ABU0EUE0_9PSEU|nr:septum site-determining protein Ssd [Amycolatopsis thermophila]MDQ0378713.1 secretion/DNA translocation related CpaE-like protein [Amycolatopsis thermophila]
MNHTRPLVVAHDEALLDEILRVAAAVGCETQRAPDLLAARPRWPDAPLVLVDEQAVDAEVELPRRPGVLLVTKGAPDSRTWQRAFRAGVEDVVALPEDETTLAAALADVVDGPGVPGGRIIGVVGGRGGAGASFLAAATALVACRHDPGGFLVDCDPLAGGVDALLGAEHAEGLRWPELRPGAGRLSMPALLKSLPEFRYRGLRLPFLSCHRNGDGPTGQGVAAVIEAGRRSGRTVVCDLPRHLDGAGLAVIARADLVVVVIPAEMRACLAARRVLKQLGDPADRVRLVVRGPAPGDLQPSVAAGAVGVPLLTSMPLERQLDREIEHGQFAPRPRGALLEAARLVLAEARSRQVLAA